MQADDLQMQGGGLLNVVVKQGESTIKLLNHKDQALLTGALVIRQHIAICFSCMNLQNRKSKLTILTVIDYFC